MRRFSQTVSSAKSPRPSGTCATPSARDRLGRAPRERLARRRRSRRSARTVPEIARSVVVLPAPFAPSSATTSPSSTRERDAVQRLDRPVARLDVAQLKQRRNRRLPDRPRSPRGFARTSAGVPSAIFRPKLSTYDAVGDRHHEVHVVLDEQHREVEVRRERADQRRRARRPPRGSARRPARRAAAAAARDTSARASSIRFSVPNGSPPRQPVGDVGEAEVVERLAAPRAAASLRERAACASARRPARSRAPSSSGRARRSGTCARCRAGRSGARGVRSRSLPSKTMRPSSGL